MSLSSPLLERHLLEGTVIVAHPLALTTERRLDEDRQRLLTQYYIAAGAGGVAIGVHSTQFEIRDPKFNLYESVLRIGAHTIREEQLDRPFIKVAGVSGPTEQALREADVAAGLGYDIALVSINGLGDSENQLIDRAVQIGKTIPLMGFYLQQAVGGRVLSFDFWKDFAEIPSVCAIKIAPFNRYQTIDVVRAVCHSSRNEDIALYTGNDDNIVVDLLTPHRMTIGDKEVEKFIAGGLLGQWGIWTNKAVLMLDEIKLIRKNKIPVVEEWLTLGARVTDANAAIFDATHNFKGCLPGIHEILRRQGLLSNILCLDPEGKLSPGQNEEIDRVCATYPELNDNIFVKQFLANKGRS